MKADDAIVIVAGGQTGRWGIDDAYPETFWLPVVGPASYLAWRLLARQVQQRPTAVLSAAEIAGRLGLGSVGGTQSGLERTLRRMDRFAMIERPGPLVVSVQVRLGDVAPTWLARLDPALIDLHARCQHPTNPAAPALSVATHQR